MFSTIYEGFSPILVLRPWRIGAGKKEAPLHPPDSYPRKNPTPIWAYPTIVPYVDARCQGVHGVDNAPMLLYNVHNKGRCYMKKALLIGTDGTLTEVEIAGLADMQRAVGGRLEAVYLHYGAVGFIDEEGKLKEKAGNLTATIGAQSAQAIMPDDVIAGDMLVLGDDGYGDNADVPDKTVRYFETVNKLRQAQGV